MTRVLFVCTGNICRSPTAEGVFRTLVGQAGLSESIRCESAGTHDYHVGDPPDLRALQAAKKRGYDLSAQRARRIAPEDFRNFDLVLVMDHENLNALSLARLRPKDATAEAQLFLEHIQVQAADGSFEVADPYYGNQQSFEVMLDLIEIAARKLIASLAAK